MGRLLQLQSHATGRRNGVRKEGVSGFQHGITVAARAYQTNAWLAHGYAFDAGSREGHAIDATQTLARPTQGRAGPDVTINRQHTVASRYGSQHGVAAVTNRNGVEWRHRVGSRRQDFPDIDPQRRREQHRRIGTRVRSCLGGNGKAVAQRAGGGGPAGSRLDILRQNAPDSIVQVDHTRCNRRNHSVDEGEHSAKGGEPRDPLHFEFCGHARNIGSNRARVSILEAGETASHHD